MSEKKRGPGAPITVDVAACRPILVRLPNELDAALRARAAREDRPLARVVRAALRAYLAEDLTDE